MPYHSQFDYTKSIIPVAFLYVYIDKIDNIFKQKIIVKRKNTFLYL